MFSNISQVRKVLFDIFQAMTREDIEACKFFIRSENTKECENIYELMYILEKLTYFTVSNKPQLGKLIELLGYINRFDLQKKLQLHMENNYENGNESTVSSPLTLNEQESKSSEESSCESESSMKSNLNDENGNESTVSSPLTLNEQESKTPEESNYESESSVERNLSGDNDNRSTASPSLMIDEEESKTTEESNYESESSVERNLSGKNGNESTFFSPLTEEESKTPEESNCESESSVERNLSAQDTEVTSVAVTSEDTCKGITKSDDLELDLARMSLNSGVTNDTATNSSIPDGCNSSGSENSKDSSHSEIKLYNYQKELSEKAKRGMNCIICSPTGSGKTITAASVIEHHLKEAKQHNRSYRVLYLVHIRFLVKHLSLDLKKILKDDVHPLEENDLLSSGTIMKKVVVVLTAQILDNALNFGHVQLSDYDLLVFDECHNTVEKHPYNEIMKKYHELKRSGTKVPQILGLSATVGRGQDPFKTIIALCANMWTPLVCCVCDENNLKELQEKNNAPIIDETIPCKSRTPDKFHERINSVMRKYIEKIESNDKIEFGDCYQTGTQEFESFLSQYKSHCEKCNLRDAVKIFDFLFTINKALIYYNELTAFAATEYLENSLPIPSEGDSQIEKEIYSDYDAMRKDLKDVQLNEKLEDNDKIIKLKELLKKLLEDHSEKKVIILCQTRFNVMHLKYEIMDDSKLNKFIKADYLIGQTELTQSQQQAVLNRFGLHELNVLISTSIAEQGLNIPDCEIVIRYLYVTSDISRRQAHGRARKKNSKCYLIAEENTDHIYRDSRNKQQEKEMDAALKKINEIGEKKFCEEVSKKIKILHDVADLNKNIGKQYRCTSQQVIIFCKECHKILCYGSDIIKKGTDYICINREFEKKVYRAYIKEQKFRHDSNIALSRCNSPNCKTQFGAIKKYHDGERLYGFVLSVRSILFQVDGHPGKIQLKKWSQHFFPINTESLI